MALNVALMVNLAYKDSQTRKYPGVRDRRYNLHSMSLAMWMLRIAGIIDDPPYYLADKGRHTTFRYYYAMSIGDDDVLDRDDQKQLGKARKQLRKILFKLRMRSLLPYQTAAIPILHLSTNRNLWSLTKRFAQQNPICRT